jgi:hypothetical protein
MRKFLSLGMPGMSVLSVIGVWQNRFGRSLCNNQREDLRPAFGTLREKCDQDWLNLILK